MMMLFAVLAGAGTMVLGLVLGTRLLRLAARTRQAPELAMGLYCLLVTLGSALLWLAFRVLPSESPWASIASAGATFAVGAAAFALAAGIARIFHAGERWAQALVALLGLELLGSWVATVAPGRPVALTDATLANALFVAGRTAVYLLGTFEAFRYAGKLRRRASLGLADPISAHQIRLWGVAWLAVAGIAVGSLAFTAALGRSIFEQPWTAVLVNVLNVTAWVCTWVAFFPPGFYQRRVAQRYAEAGA